MINHGYYLDHILRSPTSEHRTQWMLFYAQWLEDRGDLRAPTWKRLAADQSLWGVILERRTESAKSPNGAI